MMDKEMTLHLAAVLVSCKLLEACVSLGCFPLPTRITPGRCTVSPCRSKRSTSTTGLLKAYKYATLSHLSYTRPLLTLFIVLLCQFSTLDIHLLMICSSGLFLAPLMTLWYDFLNMPEYASEAIPSDLQVHNLK